ncbi:MAG TPA: alpha/beta hydrolase [Solirubrobacterales bacterium]|jgi:pimeloyl-ACP methyl ester carboxylesterase
MRSAVTLPQGTIAYSETGVAEGPPVVFIHGAFVDGRLWRKVVPELEASMRCIVPDLPLGSHQTPMSLEADLSPPGLAKLIADFLAALELERVTLVGNDTGGAICQLVVTRHPERVGRLVLTPCDAYENFLPPAFRYLQLLARVPGGVGAVAQSMRIPAVRRTPLAFGWLSKSRIPAEVLAGWTAPIIREPGVRADARKVLRGISNSYTLEAAERLRDFEGPTMLAWATEDRFFKPRFAERLAADIPGSRLEWIDDSRTFVSEDQPERLTELIGDFATA